jgi:TolB protein
MRRPRGKTLLAVIAAVLIVPAAAYSARSGDDARRQLIAYERTARNGTEIFLMNTDGSDQHRLARGCCFDWSPDGERIAYLGAGGIYVIGIDGAGLHRVADFPASGIGNGCRNTQVYRFWCDGFGVDWSPEGRRIAFNGQDGIELASVKRSKTTRLTAGDDGLPSWSPDGKRIAFQRYVHDGESGREIFVVNADGSGPRRLTRDTARHFFFDQRPISWSPDGGQITYIGYGPDPSYGRDVFVMAPDGTGKRNLTQTPYGNSDEERPIFSPDGRTILYAVGSGSINTMTPSGTRKRNLTRGQRNGHELAQWSSDGGRIVFARVSKYQWDIWMMTADGKNIVDLSNTPRPTFETAPSWSPAGP